MSDEWRRVELTDEESLRLLATVSLGRIVFTVRALPAVHPVRHVVDEGNVIIRTSAAAPAASPIAGVTGGAVVAYQADSIDHRSFVGWSVVVTGLAQFVSDESELARYQHLLSPWAFAEADYVIRIKPELVTGFRVGGAAPLASYLPVPGN